MNRPNNHMKRDDSVMRTVVGADLDPLAAHRWPPETQPTIPPIRHRLRLARWIVALMVCGLLAGGGAWLIAWVRAPQHLALARVRIEGEVHHTSRALLQHTLAQQVVGNFFALDLAVIRRALEALPWIAHVSVRRVWPLTLVVQVREHEALAHWGERSLVSPEGVIFTPNAESVPNGLVQLQGPEGSASEVIKCYRWLQRRLAPSGVTRLALSARHAWSLDIKLVIAACQDQTLEVCSASSPADEQVAQPRGLHLSLGTQDLEARVERFLHYLPRLPQPEDLEQVDLRYSNGFAARWRMPSNDTMRRTRAEG